MIQGSKEIRPVGMLRKVLQVSYGTHGPESLLFLYPFYQSMLINLRSVSCVLGKLVPKQLTYFVFVFVCNFLPVTHESKIHYNPELDSGFLLTLSSGVSSRRIHFQCPILPQRTPHTHSRIDTVNYRL